MEKNSFYSIWQGSSVVFGTIVGAGVLGLPYAFAATGILSGTLVLLLAGGMLALLMLFLGEVAWRTPGKHQLTGYANQYLGKKAKHILAAALVVNIYGAMLAYTIGQGEVLAAVFGGAPVLYSGLFFVLSGIVIVLGIDIVKHIEAVLTLIVIGLLLVLVALTAPSMSFTTLWQTGSPTFSNLLVTYGVALFACFGLTAVPQVRNILFNQSPRRMRTALLLGSLVPPLLYVLFAAVVLGVTGSATTEVATIGLGEQLGASVLLLGSLFAFFAMATSFLALGLALRNVFHRDYNLPLVQASVLTLGVPASLFLLGVRDFITVLSVVGAFALGVVGVLGVMIYLAARESTSQDSFTLVPYWAGTVLGGCLIMMFLLSMMLVAFDLWY